MSISKNDFERIMKDWDGSYKIVKSNGVIHEVEMKCVLSLDNIRDGFRLLAELEKAYGYFIHSEFNFIGKRVELFIKVTGDRIQDFLRLKNIIAQLPYLEERV